MSSMSTTAGSVIDGRATVTTAGTLVQLSTTQTSILEVAVTAIKTNTNDVVVGGPTVVAAAGTRRGTPLAAGETIVLAVNDLTDIYVDAVTNGEGVTYTALVA